MKYIKVKNASMINFAFQFDFELNEKSYAVFRSIMLDRVTADTFVVLVSDPYPITDVNYKTDPSKSRPLEYIRTIRVDELKDLFTQEGYRISFNQFNENPKMMWQFYSRFIDYHMASRVVDRCINANHDEFRNYVYIRTGKGMLEANIEMPNITISAIAYVTPFEQNIKAKKGKTVVVRTPISDKVKKFAGEERAKLLSGDVTLTPACGGKCNRWSIDIGATTRLCSDSEASVLVDHLIRSATAFNIPKIIDTSHIGE